MQKRLSCKRFADKAGNREIGKDDMNELYNVNRGKY